MIAKRIMITIAFLNNDNLTFLSGLSVELPEFGILFGTFFYFLTKSLSYSNSLFTSFRNIVPVKVFLMKDSSNGFEA